MDQYSRFLWVAYSVGWWIHAHIYPGWDDSVWKWGWEHKLISFGGVGGAFPVVTWIWNYFKSKRLLKCARILRKYADKQKRIEPNIVGFPRGTLAQELGTKLGLKYAFMTDDVIEFMEEKGWATKINYPPGCWQIN
jgi:hypothetical protein